MTIQRTIRCPSGCDIAETKQGPPEPHQHREDRDAKESAEPARTKDAGCHTVEHLRLTWHPRPRTSTISVRRFCCRPSAVAFGCQRVGLIPCPGRRRRPGSFKGGRNSAATASARACDSSKLDGKRAVSNWLVIGEAVDQDIPRFGVQRTADATEQRHIPMRQGWLRRSRTCCGWLGVR